MLENHIKRLLKENELCCILYCNMWQNWNIGISQKLELLANLRYYFRHQPPHISQDHHNISGKILCNE